MLPVGFGLWQMKRNDLAQRYMTFVNSRIGSGSVIVFSPRFIQYVESPTRPPPHHTTTQLRSRYKLLFSEATVGRMHLV